MEEEETGNIGNLRDDLRPEEQAIAWDKVHLVLGVGMVFDLQPPSL
jgi:hypothetical protein